MLPVVLPVTDESDVAGFAIFATDPDQTRSFMNDDPGELAGIFRYETHRVRGFPGATLRSAPRTRPAVRILRTSTRRGRTDDRSTNVGRGSTHSETEGMAD